MKLQIEILKHSNQELINELQNVINADDKINNIIDNNNNDIKIVINNNQHQLKYSQF